MSLLLSLLTWFWVLAPIGFLVGRLCGVWNFGRDVLLFCGLMGLSFVVILVRVAIELFHVRKEDVDELRIKLIVNRIMDERIRK